MQEGLNHWLELRKNSLFSAGYSLWGVFCFCLESQTTLVLVATSWEGRMAQPAHFLFTITVDFAVPQQKQCALGNHCQSSTVTPVLSDLPLGGVGIEWNIL